MRRLAIEPVIAAIVTTLRGSTGLTPLVTGVYNNVPQGTVYPYVEVTAPTTRRLDTWGRFGLQALVDVKVISQGEGDRDGTRILDQCIRALDFQRPTLTGHTMLGLAFDESVAYPETINGVTTRYHVATFRAWSEQSSS